MARRATHTQLDACAETIKLLDERIIQQQTEIERQCVENELRSVKNVDARYAAQCNDEAAQLDRENRILRAVMRLRNPRYDR